MDKRYIVTIEVINNDGRFRLDGPGLSFKDGMERCKDHEAIQKLVAEGEVYDCFAVTKIKNASEGGDLIGKVTKHVKKLKRFLNLNDLLEESAD